MRDDWTPVEWSLQGDIDARTLHPIRIVLMLRSAGKPQYAVRRGGEVLNKSGVWEWEPSPSGRDEEFLERCRYDDFEDAVKAVDKVLME
jgi:hypothetical protein